MPTIAPIFEQWLALQAQPNPDNIELARVLVPSLPTENLNTYLLASYYCSLVHKHKPNYKAFTHEMLTRLQAQGIDPKPKLEEVIPGYSTHILQPGFRETLDAYASQIDEHLLFKIVLEHFGRDSAYWIVGEAFYLYQNNRPSLLAIPQNTWLSVLRRYQIMSSLYEFVLPFDYDEGSMGPIPDFIYDFEEIISLEAGVLDEISPKMERLKRLKNLNLHTLYLDTPQRLNLRAFPALKTIKISINQGELTLEGGEQVEELEWLKESHSEKYPLPAALGNMQALRKLRVRCPSYSQAPLQELEALENLILEYASIDFLRDERFLNFRRCKKIHFGGFVGETLPDTLAEFTELQDFHINSVTLAVLPKIFYKLPKLERLEFSGTRMKTIPTKLIAYLLQKLKYMRLRCTPQRARDIERMAAELGSTCELKLDAW